MQKKHQKELQGSTELGSILGFIVIQIKYTSKW